MVVKAQSRRSCCAFCAPARICLFFCDVLSFLLHLSHAVAIHIDSSVPSRLKSDHGTVSLSIHTDASLNKSLTFQCHRILEQIVLESLSRNEIADGSGARLRTTTMRGPGWSSVNEKYVALLQDTDPHPVANVPAGTGESSVLIRTLGHTLYALLVTLTTGRSLRLVQRVPNKNGFEVWRQLGAENAPKTAGRRFLMLHAVLQPGMGDNPAKFV